MTTVRCSHYAPICDDAKCPDATGPEHLGFRNGAHRETSYCNGKCSPRDTCDMDHVPWPYIVECKEVEDSKNHNLPEPTLEKIISFTEKLKEYGIELREKHNLSRLTKVKP